ncbi:LPXTG cell wall anchor domain-containing protein [Leucobacter insecticola]|uniref:LPXTG cell wall anchor domain-containing protein n=1 Tax=Leucobacter insecticola TaxID=2714934 RepID=A0A6G8FK98_9MICO|nr:LPXTG cell wall anchor domain-containing protein [Leucobacter insecticola]QIM16797.1 LPXTG cell wall anchor domain-containing protein [Leucobacter insecticola]
MLLATIVAAGLLLVPAVPSQAAGHGPGFVINGVFVGSYITSTNGSNAYCIEPDGANPGAEVPAQQIQSLRGYLMQSTGHWVAPYVDTEGIRRINYIISTYGGVGPGSGWQSEQAAAVALSIWAIRGVEDAVVADWVAALRARAPQHVRALVDRFITEAYERALPAVVEAPPAPELIWMDAATATLTLPAGYEVARIESGGQFVTASDPDASYGDGNRTIAFKNEASHTVTLERIPEEGSARTEPVVVSANWSREATGWPSWLWGFQPAASDTDQLLIAAAKPETISDSGVWRTDSVAELPSPFKPVVRTSVLEAKLRPGDPYIDRVEFGLAEGSSPWPRFLKDGEWKFRTVRGVGTLYGPFTEPPVQSEALPMDQELPIVGTALIDADRGPGSYEARIEAETDPSSGYYTWVWNISVAEQGPEILTGDAAEWHLDPEYVFQDSFGIPEETHVRPMSLTISTALAAHDLVPGETTHDVINVETGPGTWLTQQGLPVPVVLRATVYRTDGNPVRAPKAPAGAEVISVRTITARAPGEQTPVEVTAPSDGRGGLTVQVCVVAEDQEETVREIVEEGCDDWGIPEESARLRLPESNEEPAPPTPSVVELPKTGEASLMGSGIGGLLLLASAGTMFWVRRCAEKRPVWPAEVRESGEA